MRNFSPLLSRTKNSIFVSFTAFSQRKLLLSSTLVKMVWRRSSLHPKKPNLAGNRDGARLYFLLSSTFLWCCNFEISALERTLSGCLLSISINFTPFPVKLISARTGIRMYTCRCISPNELRPAGGVKHSDSDLVETGELSATKALR